MFHYVDREDFTGLNHTLNITELPLVQCIMVNVSSDAIVNAIETFDLHLTTDDLAVSLVEPSIQEITIINTDGKLYSVLNHSVMTLFLLFGSC